MNRLTDLFVDKREAGGIRERLRVEAKKAKLPVSEEMLEIGDYAWVTQMGLVLVERKSVADLEGSLTSGHLDRQIARMLGVDAIRILLIEGRIGEIVQVKRGKRWKPSSMWSFTGIDHALLALQMRGIFLVHSHSMMATPKRIVDLVQWTRNEEHSIGNRLLLPPSTPPDSRLRTLLTLPKVGRKRAEQLLDGGALVDVLSSTEEELKVVIGPAAAGKVREYLETKSPFSNS